MIGQKLSHYEIIEKLGEGGMGEVYRARDTRLDRDVALKVLPEELARDPERRKRFEREAKAVAALKHPNIVTIHSVEEADGVHFITMELVEGKTLAQNIPKGGLDLDRFFEVALPLTDAVSSAHLKGVAHRDLKPANIMFDADGRLKVLDFGLAKLMEPDVDPDDTVGPDSNTAEGKVLGTAAYMSPEQAEGSKVDLRSDVFSLGIIFYEMVTGKRPFYGKTSISTISAILKDDPVSITDLKPLLPRHLGRVIRRCLSKDPGRRFQTVLDVHNELLELQDELRSESLESGTDIDRSAIRDRTEARAGSGAASPAGGGRLLKFLIPTGVVVIAAVLILMFLQRSTPDEASAGVMRLAVLPFENLGSPDDDYFADGITDAITARLAGIPGLAVISRASAKKYKNTEKDLQTVGSELGVDYILEGTIRWDKSGGHEKVRITPRLIDVSQDVQLWADNYVREIDEIFTVQADIAKQIAGALDVALAGGSDTQAPTDNVDAYQAYLRALDHDEEDMEGVRLSIDLLEKATGLDPTFALAWAELSRNHSAMYHFGYERTQEHLDAARNAADRAMAIDPTLADAHIARAYYHYWGYRDYDRALEALDFAETLAPNESRVFEVKSYVLRRQGKFEEALDYMKRASELDPQNAILIRDVALTLETLRRYGEAYPFYERALAIAPDYNATYTQTAKFNILIGDTARARSILERTPRKQSLEYRTSRLIVSFQLRDYDTVIEVGSADPTRLIWEQRDIFPFAYWTGRAYEAKGNREKAVEFYEMARAQLERELEKHADDYRLQSILGLLYAALGKKEDAITFGERGMQLMPTTTDAMIGIDRIEDMAGIYAMVGESDLALDKIEYLLQRPCSITVALVRLDATYDSLGDHPRYAEILARYEHAVP
jgi:serine/threonine protein kinase/TolB-like protein/Tfp pilus assembly protein PilF